MALTFAYWGRTLAMFDHPYNTTLLNERAVEIPIALSWLAHRRLERGIEIGNVLSHYGLRSHRVIDLYELGDGVENSDVLDLDGSFEWTLSISTLEHVRENVDEFGPIRAIEHLVELLTFNEGAMLVTIPCGHNAQLDDYLKRGAYTTRACTLTRDGDRWVQTDVPTFKPYGLTTRWAESVWIGEWEMSHAEHHPNRDQSRWGA